MTRTARALVIKEGQFRSLAGVEPVHVQHSPVECIVEVAEPAAAGLAQRVVLLAR